jgi:polyhydroxybutyrate depolymerase
MPASASHRFTHLFSIALTLVCSSVIILGCNPSISASDSGCSAGTYDQQISSGGQLRQYRLHIPSGTQPNIPLPLVFGLHGAGSSGPEFENYSGFSVLSNQAGFIVVYPQGLGDLANWDTLPNSTDVSFIRDLLDAIETRCNIDPKRVFASGHSRGGGMANRLGCDLSDRIAAIAPLSGDYENGEYSSPAKPVAVVAFHGTADPTIPYNGFGLPGAIRESYTRIGTPIPTWAANWAERNGCNAKASTVFQQEQVSGQEWTQCQSGADVLLYTITGGTHAWPTQVNAAQMLWGFFTLHPRQ